MAVFTDGVFNDQSSGGSSGSGLGTLTGIIEAASGVPAVASPALDYIGPLATTPVASATTITLPETGILIPITGTTAIDFITKPTGDQARTVILWFQSTCNVRHEVAGAGAGAANVSVVQGATVNSSYSFQAGSTLSLEFEGTQWRKFPTGPHWDGGVQSVLGADATQRLTLGASGGPILQNSSTQKITIAASVLIIQHSAFIRLQGRTSFTQGSVASASNVTFPAFASVLVTGTTTVNTFTGTGWEEGMEVSLEFDGILTITNNSGGANDFRSRDGTTNITTAAGMSLKFRFDGTDLVEMGR